MPASADDYLHFERIAVVVACICLVLLLVVQIDLKNRLEARRKDVDLASYLRRSGGRSDDEVRGLIVSSRQISNHLRLMRVALFLLCLFNIIFWLKVLTVGQ
jgi:hypothetical protein